MTPINPYKRLRELCRTGQREFERKYELSHTTLIYIESGQYPDLSEHMVTSLGRECASKGVSALGVLQEEYGGYSTLQEAYHHWQWLCRVEAQPIFDIEPPEHWTAKLSPMHFYIEATTGSAQSFCKTLKVPAASLTRFVSGQTRSMPKSIESALRDAGFSRLGRLLEMQVAWTDEHC